MTPALARERARLGRIAAADCQCQTIAGGHGGGGHGGGGAHHGGGHHGGGHRGGGHRGGFRGGNVVYVYDDAPDYYVDCTDPALSQAMRNLYCPTLGAPVGCCGGMGAIGDIDLRASFYSALNDRANKAGASAAASIKSSTGVDVTNSRVQQGAAAAVDLAQHGFNPADPGDTAKMVHAIAGGAALIPGIGPLVGAAVEGLYAFGNAIACPTEQFFASVGLSTLPPQCGGAPCKSSGNWTAAGIIHANASQLPASPSPFGEFVIGALATAAASAANCKGATLPPGVIVDAAAAIWNKTHAGPVAAVLVPPLLQLNSGLTAFGSVTLINAWQNVGGTANTPATRAHQDPYAYYAFFPTGTTAPDHPSGSPSSSGAWKPWPIAPTPPGMTVDAPRVILINQGPVIPQAAPAPPAHKTLAFRLGPPPAAAKPTGMSTGAKVATYAAAGGAGYALLWWLAKNGWKWVAPDWSDVLKAFK